MVFSSYLSGMKKHIPMEYSFYHRGTDGQERMLTIDTSDPNWKTIARDFLKRYDRMTYDFIGAKHWFDAEVRYIWKSTAIHLYISGRHADILIRNSSFWMGILEQRRLEAEIIEDSSDS